MFSASTHINVMTFIQFGQNCSLLALYGSTKHPAQLHVCGGFQTIFFLVCMVLNYSNNSWGVGSTWGHYVGTQNGSKWITTLWSIPHTGKPYICNVLCACTTWWTGNARYAHAHITLTTFTWFYQYWSTGCLLTLYGSASYSTVVVSGQFFSA